ncbi:MAG: hypothetical protein GWM98_23645 [Nitrospinaceae bacterium]|nr:hypothetical protein [Nitrospinaceae bacterium]NIR56904.1 hypothetical protein [Nitrospinaceae bacterium]NIS87366.1 hypothetical protein [Nitrospinaceae bacterium]NIT84221.1 hypothetical protein [Nitrospinaceae bacterium]NIU46406.1 hypothetical protein [Nitrospinaceae bacterium]
MKSQQGLAKTQKEMQKAQLDLNENQFEIQKLQAKTRKIQAIIQEDMRKAHTDLARKANVTIARNNDIKKILQNLKGKDNPPATAKK